MNRTYFTGIFLMLLLLAGCTKENMKDCFSRLTLDFYFTHHTDNGNLFGEQVRRIRVFLFDENEVLQLYAVDDGDKLAYSYLRKGEIQTVSTPNVQGGLSNDYAMNLDQVQPGTYKIITWGESGTENSTTYSYLHTLGVTTLKELQACLKCKEATDLPEDLVPEADEIDDLWYGAAGLRHPTTDVYRFEQVEVKNSVITERHIELIRNTNILKVTVSGLEYLPAKSTDLQLWAVTSDGSYQSDNTVGESAQSIRYTPSRLSVSDNKVRADIKVLRLNMERPVLLHIQTSDGRKIPSQPIDIVSKLLKARYPDTGEYVYKSQSDLDKIYEHPIEIRIGADLEIRIFIGEWEIVNVKPAE